MSPQRFFPAGDAAAVTAAACDGRSAAATAVSSTAWDAASLPASYESSAVEVAAVRPPAVVDLEAEEERRAHAMAVAAAFCARAAAAVAVGQRSTRSIERPPVLSKPRGGVQSGSGCRRYRCVQDLVNLQSTLTRATDGSFTTRGERYDFEDWRHLFQGKNIP